MLHVMVVMAEWWGTKQKQLQILELGHLGYDVTPSSSFQGNKAANVPYFQRLKVTEQLTEEQFREANNVAIARWKSITFWLFELKSTLKMARWKVTNIVPEYFWTDCILMWSMFHVFWNIRVVCHWLFFFSSDKEGQEQSVCWRHPHTWWPQGCSTGKISPCTFHRKKSYIVQINSELYLYLFL